MLLWPCWWSIALAAPPGAPPDGRLLALFAGGALLLRGAGCTVNDLWDRKLDKKVARTANRPLARGAVSPRGAVAALAAQLTAGLAILTQLNPFSIALGAASLPLVVAYPLAKRVTDWVRGG
jgi:4-hydroxybenzoate polyprenyltransferase